MNIKKYKRQAEDVDFICLCINLFIKDRILMF